MLARLVCAAGLLLSPGLLAAAEPVHGNLVLIGGGGRPREVMERFIALAGGPAAPIVVIPTASGEPDTGAVTVAAFREEYGCTDVRALEIHTRGDASAREAAEAIRTASGVYFTGGDQRRIMDAFGGTPAETALKEAYRAGAVVAGTSAGTACQSTLMITGDGDFEVITADNVQLRPGLGLLGGVIVDQHFIRRRRENRLISVVLEHPELLGVGIDESTAVWVKPDRTFEVLGDGWVMVLDASRATVTRRAVAGGAHLGVHGLQVDILQAGERYDPQRRTVLDPAANR